MEKIDVKEYLKIFSDKLMIPASGEVFVENEKIRLCVVKESEKQDYIALSYTYSCMKSAFKDEEFLEDLWNGFLNGKSFICTVYDQKTGDYVGYCAIKDIERPDWELAIELRPEWCHKGYGTEAVSLFLKRLAKITGKHSFRTRVATDNYASQALMKKLGASPKGVSQLLLRGEALEEFRQENQDMIDGRFRELADEFGVEPEEMLGKVLEYRLDVKE